MLLRRYFTTLFIVAFNDSPYVSIKFFSYLHCSYLSSKSADAYVICGFMEEKCNRWESHQESFKGWTAVTFDTQNVSLHWHLWPTFFLELMIHLCTVIKKGIKKMPSLLFLFCTNSSLSLAKIKQVVNTYMDVTFSAKFIFPPQKYFDLNGLRQKCVGLFLLGNAILT